jgi:hypothetical protein
MKKLFFIFVCVSMLTACGTRDNKDKKLAKGCEAGIKALLDSSRYDRQISSVSNSSFSDMADGRQIVLQAKTHNKKDGYDQDEAFTCVFAESNTFGPFGYKAEIQHLTAGEDVLGKKDGRVQGDANDFMNAARAAEAGMK